MVRSLNFLCGSQDLVADGSPCLHWLPVDSLPDNCFLLATVSSTDSPCANRQVYSELKERLTGDQEWVPLTALRPEVLTHTVLSRTYTHAMRSHPTPLIIHRLNHELGGPSTRIA